MHSSVGPAKHRARPDASFRDQAADAASGPSCKARSAPSSLLVNLICEFGSRSKDREGNDGSMSAEHERLEWKHKRLQSQNQSMDQTKGIHDVKHQAPHSGGVFGNDHIMIAGIGIGDAAAARSYAIQATLVERLKKHKKSARPRHLQRINQLLAAAELPGRNVVLHVRDDHWDDGPRLR